MTQFMKHFGETPNQNQQRPQPRVKQSPQLATKLGNIPVHDAQAAADKQTPNPETKSRKERPDQCVGLLSRYGAVSERNARLTIIDKAIGSRRFHVSKKVDGSLCLAT